MLLSPKHPTNAFALARTKPFSRDYRPFRQARNFQATLITIGLLISTTLSLSAQESPYPDVVRLNNSMPIIDEANAMFPSLVKIPDWIPPENRAHPEAVYYLYWATHYGWNIRLSWSRAIDGPYTEFNSSANRSFTHPRIGVLSFPGNNSDFQFDNGVFIRAHISSPEVLIDDENKRFVLFFHGPCNDDQKSFVATSPDGLNFNPVQHGGVEGYGVVPQILCAQYMRPFMYNNDRYAVAMDGVLCKAPDNGPPYLIPPNTVPTQTYWSIGKTPVSGVGPRHAAARVRDGRYLDYFFSRRIENEHIEMTTIDMAAGNWNSWFEMGPSVTLIDNSAPWEGDDTRDPAIYEENGSVYLLYAGGGENGIGLALLDGVHPLPVEPLPADYDPIQAINWGMEDIATSSTNFRNKSPEVIGDFVGYPFSESIPLNASSNYSAQPMYGGFLASANGKMPSSKVTSGSTDDGLDLRVQDADTLHGCLFFDSSDFHSNALTPFTFGKYSALRMKLNRHPGSLRFLVRNGEEYFVSEISPDQSGELRFRSDDDDGNWAAYDPKTSLNFDNSQPFEPRNFENITAIGILIDIDSSESTRYWLQLDEFEALTETVESFESWVAGFPSIGIQTGVADDPDLDGLSNLQEFVLGGDPSQRNHNLWPRIGYEFASNEWRPFLAFTAVHSYGVDFALENSTDLLNWDAVPLAVTANGQTTKAMGPEISTQNSTEASVFLRLKLKLQ